MRLNAKKAKPHGRFYFLLGCLLVLIFARYTLQIGIPRMGFVAIIALIALLGDRNEIVAICMCCIPLHESINFFYSMAACTGIYILKNYKSIKFGVSFVWLLVIILWELLHCFSDKFDIVQFLSPIIPLIVLTILASSDVSDLDYAFITRAMAIATAGICITMLGKVVYLSNFDILKAFVNLQRLGYTANETQREQLIKGSEINPNALGVICVLSINGLLQLRSAGHGKKSDFWIIAVLLLFGALTASRTFLLCLALMIVLLLFAQPGSFSKKFRLFATILITLVIAFLLLQIIFPDLLTYFFSRFQVEDITTGRVGLLYAYDEFIRTNPKVMFLGIGLQNYLKKLSVIYRVANNIPHNTIQEIIVAWGIIGLTIFIVYLALVYGESKRYSKRHMLLNFIPLIIIIFKSQAGQIITAPYTILTLAYAYLSMAQDFTKQDSD